MILLSAITPLGPRLAVKTTSGIIIPERAIGLPLTLEEALYSAGGIDRVRDFSQGNAMTSVKSVMDLIPEGEYRIGLPFEPRNLICIGLNYKDRTVLQELDLPKEPVIFAKLTGSVTGAGEPIDLPSGAREVGYEAELGVVIGRECRGVSTSSALDYVAGYTCINDIGARDFLRGDGQLVWAKSQDSFAPMGPYLVTGDDITDPQRLSIRSWVNGAMLQDSNTNDMIFSVRELIAYLSSGVTLKPGDVISTGTPPKIGNRQIFLHPRDEVIVEVERVGRLCNPVRGIGDATCA
jgi:2-keto-4-pentenoate hydratase/2-oxohepta-3-ene-1,7-dioic acid hydratase in catechol pathway